MKNLKYALWPVLFLFPEVLKAQSINFNPEAEAGSVGLFGGTGLLEMRNARFSADGKNINNVLAFPALFRGALDVKASKFTDKMLIAAAETLAALTPEGTLIPDVLDKSVHLAVAKAVSEAV